MTDSSRADPAAETGLDVTIAFSDTSATVTLAGTVDCFTEARLVAALDGLAERDLDAVRVDLREVDFLGAPGYWMLARLQARMAGSGGSVLVIGAPEAAPLVIGRLGLDVGVLAEMDSTAEA
jgi:anti-anti-sigma regulatory factor